MNPIKIVFFDIDGTLIDMQTKRITPATLETLRRLRAGGVKICLATGRSPITLPDIPDVKFDAYLTFNGSLCYTETETIFSNPLAPDDVRTLVRNATALGRPVAAAMRDELAANGADQDLTDYFAIANEVPRIVPDFDDLCHTKDIYQVMLGCRAADYEAVLQGAHGAKIAAWWDRAVDVIPAGGGKGIGIQKTLAYFGLTPAQAAAFGDGNNDCEMLDAVGLGVAMGNASSELKARADAVCGDVAQDGVYRYCLEQHWI